MKTLPSTRRGLYTTIILLLLGLSAVAVVYFGFLNGNFDFRNRAGFTEDRWTLDDLIGQELRGVELKQLVDKEVEYVEKVQLDQRVKDKLRNSENIREDDVDLVEYGNKFGIEAGDLIKEAKETTLQTDIKSESKSLIQEVEAATTSPNDSPSIGSRSLPTIEGFNVEKYTGTATASYPIEIPPIRGNISFSEGLNYSSRGMDDRRLNFTNTDPNAGPVLDQRYLKDAGDQDNNVGLGWELTSTPAIYVDHSASHTYLLAMGGGSRRIKVKFDVDTQTFSTYPKTDYKISRLSGGRWKVVDLGGTVYVFGTEDPGTVPYGDIPSNSANYYIQGWAIGASGDPYSWHEVVGWKLTKIGDQLGNTLEIQYVSESDGGTSPTKELYIQEVKYNYNNDRGRYLSKIKYQYVERGFNNLDWKKIHLLNRIVMENDGLAVSSYKFSYTETFKNPMADNGQAGYFLLTKIEKKGFEDSGSIEPYTFCYQSLTALHSNSTVCDGTDTTPAASAAVIGQGANDVARNYNLNAIYLVKADNGYGGEVEYLYEYIDKIDAICIHSRFNQDDSYLRLCSDDPDDWGFPLQGLYSKENYTGFYRVSKLIANNDSADVLGEGGKLKVTSYEYPGKSYGYAGGFGLRDQYDRSKVDGLEFLGYDTVVTKVYEPVSRSQIDLVKKYLTGTEQKTYVGVKRGAFTTTYRPPEQASCFMIDPRKGMEYETNILDQNGNRIYSNGGTTRTYGQNLNSYQITYSNATTQYRLVTNLASECKVKSEEWVGYKVFPTISSADAEGKKSKTETVYDFQMEPDRSDNHGLPVKQINYGNPDSSGDETYSYTLYINASNLGGQEIYDRYLSRNLFALPSITFSSTVNANRYSEINVVPAEKRVGQVRNYYDGANDSGGQTWNDVKGLPTQTVSTITQKYPSNVAPDQTIAIKSSMEYNSYWMPKRVSSSDGTTADTFYDSIYNSYPICQIQWKAGAVQSYNLSNCYVNYGQKGESVNAFVTKSFYNENPSSLTQPNNIAANNSQQGLARGIVGSTVDSNGSRTDYEYDEYGRVTRVFNSDPTEIFKTQRIIGRNQDYANQYASYYDNESPMRTRVVTRLNPTDPGVNPQWKVADTLMDGFGNEIQTIAYDLHDKTGTFRSVSHTLFNGIGQVEKKYDAVKLANASAPAVPQLIPFNQINGAASTGTITETQYDFHSRPVEVKTSVPGSGLQTVESTSYDGYIARATNSRNVRTVTESDAYGNVIRTVEYQCESGYVACNNNTGGTGITTRFEYDRLLGKPTKVIDPKGVTVQESYYDTAGNVLYSKDLDRGTSTVYFDSKGRVNKVVDAKGVSVNTTTFDGLNRPKVVSVKNASNDEIRKETYTYDGQMLGVVSETKLFDFDLTNSALQITTSEADLLGRTTKSTTKTLDLTDTATLAGQGDPKYITQEKTENFSETGTRLLSETKIASALTGSNLQTIDKVGYTYDLDGKLIKSTDKQTNTNYINNINYNHKGQPDVVGLGNNSQERYSYDAFGRMTRKVVKSTTNNNTWFDVNYKYETINGNTTSLITQIQSNLDSTERNSFLYDSLGRLEGTANNTSSTPNTEYNADYLYDVLGNITGKTEEEIGGSARSNMNDPRYFSNLTNQYKNGSNGCVSDADYINNTGYNANVNGCPYHALKRADLDTGSGPKRTYYLYDKKGNIVKEVNTTDNKSRVYEYSVLDLPISISDYNNRNATGDPESKSFYVYGFGAIRVGKVLGSDTSNPPPQNEGSTVVINAKGNNAGGEWSKMQLKVNGQMLKEWTVNTSEYSDEYRFTTSTPIDLTNDRVEVYFVNDWYGNGQDRNLWIAYIEVDGERFLALDTREGHKIWSHGAKWTSQYGCGTEGYMLTDRISCQNGYFRLPNTNASPSGESGDQGSGNTKNTVPENTEGTTGGTSNPILDKINSR